MAGWEDVAEIAMALPEVAESTSYGERDWKVRKKTFAWERPLRKTELKELGDAAPTGEILGLRVADEEDKQALISSRPDVFFATPHFDGYAAVLVLLDRIPRPDLEEALVDAWLSRAPKRIAAAYLEERGGA